ncbi:MAG TPA: hypothetical protein VHY08_02630 [Bacillota bacterium]|nr:hypothetical protein [Bacillota bacterium]
MDAVKFIEYQTKKIVLVDLSNIKEEWKTAGKVQNTNGFILSQPLNSVLLLINLTNFDLKIPELRMFSKAATETKPYIKAAAAYGLSGFVLATFEMFTMNHQLHTKIFETQQPALDWLISAGC